ncbi:MAG: PqqC-like protein [Akkermansiaceae bacterium]|nr:PqqC-like protein [Akkermansiaceae bacterium]
MMITETASPLPSVAEPADTLMQWVETASQKRAILSNSYFTALKTARFPPAAFTATQRQFYFAVRYFSRPMAALMARMPTSTLRQGLIHNLSEEHGFEDDAPGGAADFDPALAHDMTFLAFLKTLGVSAKEMAGQRELPVVRAFNVALMGACAMERIEVAFGCLGVIEYAFADICEVIGDQVVKQGWVAADQLVHYKLHAQIDKGHAADFFRVVRPAWDRGGEDRAAIEDGIALGLHLFHRLYEDLHHEAVHGN